MLMNLTLMKETGLPPNSRHVNEATVTTDWGNEYPTTGSYAAFGAARRAPASSSSPPSQESEVPTPAPTSQEIRKVIKWHGTELCATAIGGSALLLSILYSCQ